MMDEYVKLIIGNFAKRKKRSFLTIFSIVIGIASVVSIVSLGYGLEDVINEQFEILGTDKLMIMPGDMISSFAGGGSSSLAKSDVDIIRGVGGIKMVGVMMMKIASVEYRSERKYTFVSGIPTDKTSDIISSMQGFDVAEGRGLRENDGNVVVAGYMIAHDSFFEEPASVGDRITIEGTSFKIIGILDRIGNRQDDSQFLIPLDTARTIFDEPDQIDIIIAQVEEGYDAGKVAEDVKEALRKDHGLKEGEEDFTVQTFEQLMDMFSSVFNLVITIVIGIAAISLLVGGLGIMNTMYMSILERTREIGIMKSIGATNRNVMAIYLVESGFLGLFGGAVGMTLGILIAKGIEFGIESFFHLRALITPELIVGTLLFSFIVGVVSGLLPARRAARLQPVEALRYE